jgi:hypothetical protein
VTAFLLDGTFSRMTECKATLTADAHAHSKGFLFKQNNKNHTTHTPTT